jgi:hypothetical protein
MPQHFLDVQAADDVIEVAAVDRIARVRLCADDRRSSSGSAPTECRRAARAAPSLRRRAIAELEQVAQQLA